MMKLFKVEAIQMASIHPF